MSKAIISNYIYIPYNEYRYEELKKELTYVVPSTHIMHPPETITTLHKLGTKALILPVGRMDLIPENYTIEDKRIYKPVDFPEINSSVKLRSNQQEAVDKINDNYIVVANPSWGKTFTGLCIAKNLGQKTLILVHTLFLRDQWIEECKFLLGITPGIISGKIVNLDAPIVIGNIQSVIKLKEKITKEFGTIIVDEAHHTPANTFTQILTNNRARYKLGLTATPKRKDQREVLMFDYISKTNIFKAKSENALVPIIICVKSNIEMPAQGTWQKSNTELLQKPEYIDLILNIAKTQVKKGHKVLVTANRVDFLQLCAAKLPNAIVITGITKDRKNLLNRLNLDIDIVFGSQNIFSEGISINLFSSLILASPSKNEVLLEQLIGRICRPILDDNGHNIKTTPEVIDIHLNGRTAKNQQLYRLNFYKKQGWDIHFV